MDYTAAEYHALLKKYHAFLKEYHALEKRIEALEAQELGFVQSLCSQSEDIGRLKQRIEALEAAASDFIDTASNIAQNLAISVDEFERAEQLLHAHKLAALLPGRGDE